jgi:L-iduronidase
MDWKMDRQVELTVDATEPVGPLEHFWRSTGFTPAKLLEGQVMQQTLAWLGAIPHEGIRHVRIHDLLDLVEVDDPYADAPNWDWSRLDAGLAVLVDNSLQPIFEIMGHPSGHFDDMGDEKQVRAWKRMVTALAEHLMDRFGREEVQRWYFEVWNEPDTRAFRHPWGNEDVEKLNNYYDACSVGLAEANEKLLFGGPGTAMGLSTLLKGILAHLDGGTCFFTGQKPRCDFLSVHIKGGWSFHPVDPSSDKIMDDTREALDYIREHHPALLELPFLNDECDPLIGWKDRHRWRTGPYYASIACRIIDRHLREILDEGLGRFELLSNDNGFLGGWEYRTHLTRFDRAPGVCLVKKPVLQVMTLLAQLGDERIAVQGLGEPGESFGCLATRRGRQQVALLVWHHHDRTRATGTAAVDLTVRGLGEGATLAHWRIDAEHGNPFELWEQMGQPDPPSAEQAQQLRDAAELTLLDEPGPVEVRDGIAHLSFELPMHAVSLLVFSAPQAAPEKVTGLRGSVWQGPSGDNELLLAWDCPPSRAIRTYEVLASESADGPFQRINAPDLLDCAFLHARPEGQRRFYKVRAVDVAGQPGPESEVFEA